MATPLADANPGQTAIQPPISKPTARTNIFTSCYFRNCEGGERQQSSPPETDPSLSDRQE
jgi:hypothetical protein